MVKVRQIKLSGLTARRSNQARADLGLLSGASPCLRGFVLVSSHPLKQSGISKLLVGVNGSVIELPVSVR